MSEAQTGDNSSWSRNWRGNYHTWMSAHRKYDFPVTVRRIGEEEPKSEHALQYCGGEVTL